MRGRLGKLCLAFLIGFTPLSASAGCLNLWHSLAAKAKAIWHVEDPIAFQIANFDKAKTFFAYKLDRGEKITPKELSELGLSRSAISLALMEASADHAGTRAGIKFSLLGSPLLRKAEEKAMAQLDLSKPLAWADIESFLQRVYLSANLQPEQYKSLPTWISSHLPTPPREILRQRLQEAIWRHDLEGALTSLGITRDPTFRDNIRNWLAAHPNLSETAYNLAIDTFSWKLIGTPVSLPKFQTTRALTIPPELVERARREGFDSVYDDLYKRYGGYAKFDMAWSAARTAIYRSAVVVIGYGILAALRDHPFLINPKYWQFLHRFKYVDDSAVKDLQDRIFDRDVEAAAEAIRREQFLSFQKAYDDTEGPFSEALPNPWDLDYPARVGHFPATYKDEADATWRVLKGMTPAQLRATFGMPKP